MLTDKQREEGSPIIKPEQSFPPSYCVAWEDCQHDGVCHDPSDCGAEGPSEPEQEEEAP